MIDHIHSLSLSLSQTWAFPELNLISLYFPIKCSLCPRQSIPPLPPQTLTCTHTCALCPYPRLPGLLPSQTCTASQTLEFPITQPGISAQLSSDLISQADMKNCKLCLNIKASIRDRSTCLSLLKAGIKSMHHPHTAFQLFVLFSFICWSLPSLIQAGYLTLNIFFFFPKMYLFYYLCIYK